MIVLGVIVGLLVLTALVTIHEFGHFLAARKNGVKVNEFGIGFPPRAVAWLHVKTGEKKKNGKPKWKWELIPKKDWDKKQKTLIFSINWLPIGGFCAMDGETDADTRKGTFGAASYWSKTKILFAGVTMNWLAAWVIFTVLAVIGMPKAFDGQFYLEADHRVAGAPVQIASVMEDSAAAHAGLQEGDLLISVCKKTDDTCEGKTEIIGTSTVQDYNDAHQNETVTYTIERGGKPQDIDVELSSKADSQYVLGVSMVPTGNELYYSTWSAPLVGAVTTVQYTGETYRGLWNMLAGLVSGIVNQFSSDDAIKEAGKAKIEAAGDSVAGPVGIIGQIFPAAVAGGPMTLLYIAAVITVSLACMNVLPIPALDGGRWLLITIARIRGKPLTEEVEAKIISRAFIVLIFLIILITILDITRIFR